MKYRFYTTSQKAWSSMIRAMQKAEKSIYLEMFILLDDTEKTHNFFSLLKEKARSGVEVVVIADSIGSFSLKAEKIKELKEAGIEFFLFSHFLRWTHRKILVVDKHVAFLGGVNIKEEIRNWRDAQIRVEGSAVAKMVLKSFAKSYKRCGGQNSEILALATQSLPRRIKYWVIDNWPDTIKPFYINNYYRQKIKSAVSSLQIVTPYLLPPRWLLITLDEACRRGVKVEIIVPKDTDIKSLNKINYLNSCRLAAIGVKIYLSRHMNHAKLMIIDEKEGVVGSQNMDIMSMGPGLGSMQLGYEAGIFSRQKNFVADLGKIVEGWRKESDLLSPNVPRLRFFDKVVMGILKFLYPIF